MTDQQDENKLIAERRAKLTELREQEGTTFPNDFRPQHSAAELQAGFGEETKDALEQLGKIVCIAGRVIRNRGAFMVVQDSSGTSSCMSPKRHAPLPSLSTSVISLVLPVPCTSRVRAISMCRWTTISC